jgi:hypothetical protein
VEQGWVAGALHMERIQRPSNVREELRSTLKIAKKNIKMKIKIKLSKK